ncbi:LuxR C-terminal-related transcriptional regulator [Marinobacter sp. BGYM27]|uniref:LuxR C-terminal-related transcriptional regulator n=1 Tax=Marinobacter sp. BGYM27 TaxID=2975597 RepID=UPI0021A6F3AF|nr:LuxR C-terminal-related transcriptional regulator [Marinobacter sp. BGYM27]MDG5498931.1 LuxR C-terminal-related transcriptional regulator [Marinobacter sp. BGYM27]
MARKKHFQRQEVELAIRDAFPPRRGSVYEMACNGFSAAEIAANLSISARTVEWHLDEVKGQLSAINLRDAISQGWMHGLLKAKGGVRACAFILAIFSSYQMAPARTVRTARTAKVASYYRLSRSETAAS